MNTIDNCMMLVRHYFTYLNELLAPKLRNGIMIVNLNKNTKAVVINHKSNTNNVAEIDDKK